MMDIVVPRGNEAALAAMASKLGMGALCFLYPSFSADVRKKLDRLSARFSLPIFAATSQRSAAPLCVMRAAQPTHAADMLFDVEPEGQRDFHRSRNSGLTPEMLSFLKQHRIALGFSVHRLLDAAPQQFGRVQQNIRVCRKAGVSMCFASLADEPYAMRAAADTGSLFRQLGMTPGEVKKAASFAWSCLQANSAAGGKALAGVEWSRNI